MRPKVPTKAMLDGDIILYRVAFWAEAINAESFEKKLRSTVKEWLPEGITSFEMALSCHRSKNFRRDMWPNYKKNRDSLYVPEFLHDVRDAILDIYKCKHLPKIEADDILGIYAKRAVSITIDKDLLGVQGWHYNPDKDDNIRYITKDQAYRFFCKQWMSGDATDCIPGLWRIGPKKADDLLDTWPKSEWECRIIEMFAQDKYRVREDCDIPHPDIATTMARCVKILGSENYNLRTKTIKHWVPKVGT